MTIAEPSPLMLDELLGRIDEAQVALRTAPYGGLKSANCRFADGRLVLSGSVTTFYLKQMAQTLILQVLESAIPVDNRLEVASSHSTDTENIGEDVPNANADQ